MGRRCRSKGRIVPYLELLLTLAAGIMRAKNALAQTKKLRKKLSIAVVSLDAVFGQDTVSIESIAVS